MRAGGVVYNLTRPLGVKQLGHRRHTYKCARAQHGARALPALPPPPHQLPPALPPRALRTLGQALLLPSGGLHWGAWYRLSSHSHYGHQGDRSLGLHLAVPPLPCSIYT